MRPESSPRFQEVLRPAGYAHELRLVLLAGERAWGGVLGYPEPARHR